MERARHIINRTLRTKTRAHTYDALCHGKPVDASRERTSPCDEATRTNISSSDRLRAVGACRLGYRPRSYNSLLTTMVSPGAADLRLAEVDSVDR
jgi:hypothetical protein